MMVGIGAFRFVIRFDGYDVWLGEGHWREGEMHGWIVSTRFWCEPLKNNTVVVDISFSDDDMNGLVPATEFGLLLLLFERAG